MFGERYFTTRERLTEVVRGVRELALETGADTGPLEDERKFLSGLKTPFLFVVCGEVNSGKSTFINGLFGRAICKTNVLPETATVQRFRYGKEERDEMMADSLEERYRNLEFLQDFNVVDTPGTNSVEKGHQAITERFLPEADLVLFIFPVSNPWGAATWDFVSKFPDELKGRLALVLQQKDQRSDADIAVMVEHMKALAVHKIGEAPEVFPVSGLQSFEAKRTEPFRNRLWQESGYPALEEFVSRIVSRSPSRRKVLRAIRNEATATLRRIEDRMEIRRRTLDSDQGFLRDIENEVDHARERHAQLFVDKFSGLADAFAEQSEAAATFLQERTTMTRTLWSLFHKDETPADIEKGLIVAVEKAIEEQSVADSDELVATCRAHWETVIPRVEERLEMPAPDFDEEATGFEGAKERFAKRLGRAARKAVMGQKIRGMLDMQMETRRAHLRHFVVFTLVLWTLAGILGFFQMNLWGGLLLVAGLIFFGFGLAYSHRSSRELVTSFREKSSGCRRSFAEDLSADYQEGVRGFFVEYAQMFEGIRRHVAELKMKLKPQLDRWSDYFLELNAIDQEL